MKAVPSLPLLPASSTLSEDMARLQALVLCSIVILCSALLQHLAFAGTAEASSRPGGDESSAVNVILLMADQMRFDVMGCAGNPVAITPNLDKLASEGVVSVVTDVERNSLNETG